MRWRDRMRSWESGSTLQVSMRRYAGHMADSDQ
jgi:hypothetical protein